MILTVRTYTIALHSTETNLGVTRVVIFITPDDNDLHFDCEDDSNLLWSHCISLNPISQCRDKPRGDNIYHHHHFDCEDDSNLLLYITGHDGTPKRWPYFGLISSFTGFRWENPQKSLLAVVMWQSLGKLLGFPAKLGELVSLGKGGHMDDDAGDSLCRCRCWHFPR